MKLRHLALTIGVALIGVVPFGIQASAQETILDQENAPIWNGSATNIQTSNEVGQSFQPLCNNLSRVDVDLIYQGGPGSVGAKVLRNGLPIPGAQAQTFIEEDGWVQLELETAVSVTPGETLVLRLESDTFPLPLWKYAGDTYPDGTRLFSGQALSGDFFFRTYSTSCPSPTTLLKQLKQDVIDLNLKQGLENSLVRKLDEASAKLQDDNPNNDPVATNKLQDFISQVNAQRSRGISKADADVLIAAAEGIISLLSSGAS